MTKDETANGKEGHMIEQVAELLYDWVHKSHVTHCKTYASITEEQKENYRAFARDFLKTMPSLRHAEVCRLSQVFNNHSNLGTDADRNINEWLKSQILLAHAKMV